MPEIDFTIESETGELQMHIRGIAGPACDDIASLVTELAGTPGRDEVTADYYLRPRVISRTDARVQPRRR